MSTTSGIEAMRGNLSEHIDASYFESLGWRDALLAWARDYLRAFAQHPKIIAVMATTAISDPATLATYEKVVASLVPGGRYEEIADALHFPNVEHPNTFNRIMMGWLQSL